MRLYSTIDGLLLERDQQRRALRPGFSIDALFASADPGAALDEQWNAGRAVADVGRLLAPLQSQEVWAAGVTYLRSRTARMEESKEAGGDSFYDRVYEADRPELFFKSTPHRVAAPDTPVRIRGDSNWNVPEPELTLAINAGGRIFGHTIGNDMSSRDIEGENPLYLPQAKLYDRSAALGPCLVVSPDLPSPETVIAIAILRAGASAFAERTTVGRIKRPLPSLADWLFRENTFPHGAYLMTGTGIVPPDGFTLRSGDEIRITIDGVGTLVNSVA
ncbi:MAG: Fumarylacetoacetate hydrolase family protein [Verrucomicrobia bacterium]|nr:Fumarylacetoacetate hydrolase family protein [Verrucomicrobiota bacterium]